MRHYDLNPNEFGVLNRVSEFKGGDLQTRLMLDMDLLFAREQNGPLDDLYAYWDALARHNGKPSAAAVGPVADLRARFGRAVSLVDVESDNPLHYFVQNHPRLTPFLDHDEKRLAENESALNAQAVASEYYMCKELNSAMYHEIDQTFDGRTRHFTRLVVPLTGWDGRVSKLLYAVRPIEISGYRDGPAPIRANDNSQR